MPEPLDAEREPVTPGRVLDLPMQDNDAGASTVRGYLLALLAALWAEKDQFSGKRPFGDSGWYWDLMIPLVRAGYIDGEIDADGDLEDCDSPAGGRLIAAAIQSLGTDSRSRG